MSDTKENKWRLENIYRSLINLIVSRLAEPRKKVLHRKILMITFWQWAHVSDLHCAWGHTMILIAWRTYTIFLVPVLKIWWAVEAKHKIAASTHDWAFCAKARRERKPTARNELTRNQLAVDERFNGSLRSSSACSRSCNFINCFHLLMQLEIAMCSSYYV